ncbi:hypothetical protein PQR73_014095 [Mycobacterium marinum]|uniref:hypothetical protein n=1 Tax=Mycobacterium marinum TaxID=1781 RepID=UPI0023B80FA0|nr:hypothetical protein [Mycobacterium marinum]WDZ11887.1 hypothetical protein PQR73_014095 [Mycobacterium marinum]
MAALDPNKNLATCKFLSHIKCRLRVVETMAVIPPGRDEIVAPALRSSGLADVARTVPAADQRAASSMAVARIARGCPESDQLAVGNGPFTRFPITGSRPFPVIGTGHDWVHFTGTREILRANQRAQIVVAITDTIRRPTEVFGR